MANVTTIYYGPAGADKDHPLTVGGKDYVRDKKTGTVEVSIPKDTMETLAQLGHVFDATDKGGQVIAVPSVATPVSTADPEAPKDK